MPRYKYVLYSFLGAVIVYGMLWLFSFLVAMAGQIVGVAK